MAELQSQSQPLPGTVGASRGRMFPALPRSLCGEIVLLLDIALIASVAVASGFAYHEIFLQWTPDVGQFLGVGVLGGVMAAIAFHQAGLYGFDRFSSVGGQAGSLLGRWTATMLALLALAFLTKTSAEYSRGWVLAWFVTGYGALLAWRVGLKYALRELSRDGGLFARRVAVVGATDLADRFIQVAHEREPGMTLVGLFDDRVGLRDGCAQTMPVTGDLDALIAEAQAGRIDEIVVTLPWSAEERIGQIVRRLSLLPISTRLCPDKAGLRFADCTHSVLGGVTLLNVHSRPLEGWGGLFKEIEDRLLSGLALLFLSPLLLLIAAAVKLDSPGPVFFRQRRHGFNHNVFYIYKFRTMTVQDDGEVVKQATKDDQRVTRLGRFLRRSSLDELPQLINVLCGDMSLVGPRPHALAHNNEYAQLIEDYAGRHKMKPGITGWAQVRGFRGEIDSEDKLTERVRHDLYYVEHWSIWFDIKILFLTVFAVLFPKNAY